MSQTAVEVTDFDLKDDLPTGTVVLEASAGTGKTHAIVSLAVQYLAAGTPVDRLLMATFSNAASDELRHRTRSRVAECLAALRDRHRPSDDEVVALLRAGTTEEVELRRRGLTEAMSDFDAATVATTHTFCNRMLAALGFLGERAQRYPIVENVDELVAELARDLYLARFAGAPEQAPPDATVAEIAIAAVAQSAAVLAPDTDEADEAAQVRLDLARTARTQVDQRKRLARIRTYDDLQNVLYRIITDPDVGESACRRIREQFSVVLIDEFQDTDPQQWEIIRRCFHGHVPLVLVGDPKQSIYAFRGAEVRSYLQAVRDAQDKRQLTTNWRSDGPLVQALGAVFGGSAFGDREIGYPPVTAKQSVSRIACGAPLRLRAFVTGDFPGDGLPSVGQVRERVIDDVADDIAVLLNSGTLIDGVDGAGERPVAPGDIAILVRANKTVEPLQEALAVRGISSVVRSGTSIFKTPAARHWWYVLSAIEQPSNSRRVRLAALTPLLGRTAEQLDAGGDEAVGALAAQLADLGRIFAEGGFASMSARLLETFGTEARLLAGADGERLLTDLRQLADLCNRRVATGPGGLSSLVTWLSEQIEDGSRLRHGGAQTRRLDRDTHAVQIMTVHASKGLEFPIVYVPFGWDGARVPNPETFLFHDDDGRRSLDVGGEHAPGRDKRAWRADNEEAGEDLRLLYVAMTRARSQVVAWWGPSVPTKAGALHRLLFTAAERDRLVRAGTAATAVPPSVELPATDRDIVDGLRAVAALAPEQIAVEPAGRHPRGQRWRADPAGGTPPTLSAAEFTRTIDQAWRRTSYSGIVRDAHAAHAGERLHTGSEPEDGLIDDEPADPADGAEPAGVREATAGTPSPMNGLPFGAGFGTLVHEVLEHVDTASPDLAAHVYDRTVEGAAHRGVDLDVDTLARALTGVLTTPLGFGDLASIGPADRLAELDFELPLAPPGFTLDEVGDLLAAHLPAADPLHHYAEVVRTVSEEHFRGYLTGSIDSVLRTPDGQFVVVDYKTNRLRPGELTVEDFDTAAMAAEMMSAHYPLQALLYAVALHRYLRWRLPGYEPERHLGPIQYHFVRGMAGPQTPPGCGVFEWRPPAALICALSDLLAGVEGPR
ncbi:UvrD-helicase domain-containing protein [Gordonia caeni]|uniref:RecBCD enzyme subunit RecB n=1 Tax=Gordonia caeni TaxID=1007097 RepID=A0ABP7PLC0_9ACTN